jgi:pimeloyl-ACP methyl ester carboxylesterase
MPVRAPTMFHLIAAAATAAAMHPTSLRSVILAPRRTSLLTLAEIEGSPVIIIPGFGNANIDYVAPLGQPEETGFRAALQRRGFTDVRILPVERIEWARVIFGLILAIVWRPLATPSGPAYNWFVQRLRNAVDEAHAQSGGERVLLVGHSAGGWLARAMLADGTWQTADGKSEGCAADKVSGLVTLGTPHFAPPEGFPDMTLGVLKFVNDEYPGAFLAAAGIAYVTVGGDAIVGSKSPAAAAAAPPSSKVDSAYAKRGEGSAARVAFNSYEMVCGRGDVTGDGVVPLSYTQLEGATQLELKGVLHSINEAGTTVPTERWYGSENVVDRWLPAVRAQVARAERRRSAAGGGGGGGGSFADATNAVMEQVRAWLREQVGGPRR